MKNEQTFFEILFIIVVNFNRNKMCISRINQINSLTNMEPNLTIDRKPFFRSSKYF